MDEFEMMILTKKPGACGKCNGPMNAIGKGKYKCMKCSNIESDNFGRIYDYLEKNGPTNYFKISKDLGLSKEVIDAYLEQGRIELKNK